MRKLSQAMGARTSKGLDSTAREKAVDRKLSAARLRKGFDLQVALGALSLCEIGIDL